MTRAWKQREKQEQSWEEGYHAVAVIKAHAGPWSASRAHGRASGKRGCWEIFGPIGRHPTGVEYRPGYSNVSRCYEGRPESIALTTSGVPREDDAPRGKPQELRPDEATRADRDQLLASDPRTIKPSARNPYPAPVFSPKKWPTSVSDPPDKGMLVPGTYVVASTSTISIMYENER